MVEVYIFGKIPLPILILMSDVVYFLTTLLLVVIFVLTIVTNNNGTINWLEGNIDEDPQFIGGDPFSYQLTENSPCIDAGNPNTTGLNLPPYDLAGNPRISGGIIDMGVYEWQDTTRVDEQKFYKNLYVFTNTPNPFKSSTTITFISSDYERIKDYKYLFTTSKDNSSEGSQAKKTTFG